MKRYPLALFVLIAVALVLSGLAPSDRTTWWLAGTTIGATLLLFVLHRDGSFGKDAA
jgi:hypothetical protein